MFKGALVRIRPLGCQSHCPATLLLLLDLAAFHPARLSDTPLAAASIAEHRRKKAAGDNSARMPRTVVDRDRSRTAEAMAASLESMGLDASAAVTRARSQSRGRELRRKRARSAAGDVDMADAGAAEPEQKKRVHSSKSRCGGWLGLQGVACVL